MCIIRLRIRRPQVRVLPSALVKILQKRDFSFFPDGLWRLIKLLLPLIFFETVSQAPLEVIGSPRIRTLETSHG